MSPSVLGSWIDWISTDEQMAPWAGCPPHGLLGDAHPGILIGLLRGQGLQHLLQFGIGLVAFNPALHLINPCGLILITGWFFCAGWFSALVGFCAVWVSGFWTESSTFGKHLIFALICVRSPLQLFLRLSQNRLHSGQAPSWF